MYVCAYSLQNIKVKLKIMKSLKATCIQKKRKKILPIGRSTSSVVHADIKKIQHSLKICEIEKLL